MQQGFQPLGKKRIQRVQPRQKSLELLLHRFGVVGAMTGFKPTRFTATADSTPLHRQLEANHSSGGAATDGERHVLGE
ncbi:MAG: Uncharacterised protein [Synechococcus sp. CC9902]|nr:MAG: Uncharacterised protein [Synechococcus sp. CC9902]